MRRRSKSDFAGTAGAGAALQALLSNNFKGVRHGHTAVSGQWRAHLVAEAAQRFKHGRTEDERVESSTRALRVR
jgi:hypothetical protein